MDSEGITREIAVAREGRVGRETRVSALDGTSVRYVAVPGPGETVVRLGAGGPRLAANTVNGDVLIRER